MTDIVERPTTEEIVAVACKYAFGEPLISNNFRAIIVEAILRKALPTEWIWCSRDWWPWDFQHKDGTKLEVKQSAAKQSWETTKPPRPTFDIRPRTGRYEGTNWIKSTVPERFADIYLFGYHSRTDAAADHRDAQQWEFFAVPTPQLPNKNSLSLLELRMLAGSINVGAVHGELEHIRVKRRL